MVYAVKWGRGLFLYVLACDFQDIVGLGAARRVGVVVDKRVVFVDNIAESIGFFLINLEVGS